MFTGRRLTTEEINSYALLPTEIAMKVRIFKIPEITKLFRGITIGRWIFLTKELPCDGKSNLIAHELVHVRQWVELGILGFLSRYLSEFFKKLIKTRNWMKSYYQISLECQAREEAARWTKGVLLEQ